MQFLYPIGLITLASLIVPIVIHLWRVKQGKTLKIGSIALLGESAASNAKSIRISDWILLLLRCLLFALIAFLLAGPYLKGNPLPKNKTGWILLSQREFKDIYHHQKKTIDSLLARGYQLHEFDYGFKPLLLKDTLSIDSNQKNTQLNSASLLKQLNHQLPNNYPVWIFANKYTNQFDETLPTVHLNITWRNIIKPDSIINHYTQFLNRTYKGSAAVQAISYNIASNQKIPPLNVVLSPINSEDAKYVKAALNAIGSYLNQQINILDTPKPDAKADALFWLSQNKIPASFSNNLKKDGVLFRYASGKNISNTNYLALEEIGNADLKIFKAIAATEKDKPVWKSSFGNAILSYSKENGYHSYLFYSQLNPQWTDLVWQGSFAKAIMPILFHEKPERFAFDRNYNRQMQNDEPVAHFESAHTTNQLFEANYSLEKTIWVLILLTLITERILTFRNKSVLKQG